MKIRYFEIITKYIIEAIFKEEIPVAIASFCCNSTRYSFPPEDIFLNASNSLFTPRRHSPFVASAGGFSLISFTILSEISLHGFNESPSLCK